LEAFGDQTKKSFDFALESVKQLVALATLVLAFTVTFAEKMHRLPTGVLSWSVLTASWLLLLLSIVAGIWALLQITTILSDTSAAFEPTVRVQRISLPVLVQIGTFMGALILFVGYVAYFAFTK
jgi:hypothetical protein